MEPQHIFVYHVDIKAEQVHRQLVSLASELDNVYIVDSEREEVTWGGFSIVNATLAGMRMGWQSGRAFDYMVLLSGSSYPIKSNNRIRETLAASPNAVYMDVAPEPSRPTADVSSSPLTFGMPILSCRKIPTEYILDVYNYALFGLSQRQIYIRSGYERM